MKKIVFRFWIINFIISIVLFVIYRILISQTKIIDGNFLEDVLQILDLVLNLIYSFVYLIGMFVCSCALFLNLIDKIRHNFYLSLLTFLGLPIFCVAFIFINVATDNLLQNDTVTIFRNLLIFSVIYLLLTTLEFLLFRKRINKLRAT